MLKQDNSKEATFKYTYSPKQKADINEIKQKYMTRDECKTEKILKLDQGVDKKGTVVSIVAGTAGMMFLGIGMSLIFIMGDMMFVFGIILGLIGIAIIAAAYPLYVTILKKERTKIAPMIMKLIDELEKQV